jgi:threonine dehydrogenase-like Zn-dependent dehydrogenase
MGPIMRALLYERNLPRFVASRLVSTLGSGRAAGVGPLRLVDTDPPALPGDDWHRVSPLLSGICGSDLATLDGRSSRYFEDLVSFPFVPGHEVVGTLGAAALDARGAPLEAGTRVVLEPVLGCRARGIEPLCPSCAQGLTGGCERVAFGHLRPGLQTGFCVDTGGGWSTAGLVAHESQLHAVPEALSDEDAVTIEPLACAVHAVMNAGINGGDTVAVIGAGMLGLGVVAALTSLARHGTIAEPSNLMIGAKYPHQRSLAEAFGATATLPPTQLARAVRRRSGSLALGSPGIVGRLTGGADVVIDCVGSNESLRQSLDLVRPRGRVVLVGMPGHVSLDLASLWHREVTLAGAYAYGTETLHSGATASAIPTFALAIEVVAALHTGQLVSATYPLDRFEEAVGHAGASGRRGAVKIAFDLRPEARIPKNNQEDAS